MSAWPELVTAALIGTERTVVPATRIPGLPSGDAPGQVGASNQAEPGQVEPARDPAARLLDQAALLTVARRAGRTADEAEPLPAAGLDPRPAVSPAAGERLARVLGGEHPDLLAEWLGAAVARGLRAPAQLLPALLDRGRRAAPADPSLRLLVASAGGARARWLAGLNPDWKWLTGLSHGAGTATDAGSGEGAGRPGDGAARPDEDLWRLGDAGQRRGYLVMLRARDPGAARELIAAGWAAVSASERVMFLRVLAEEPGLVPADEPLLEAALDDRADDVRSWAGYLLATLPGSALGRRMADRALRTVAIRSGPQGRYLAVRPPDGYDPDLRRDGITPGPITGRTSLGESARLVLEITARTLLQTWTDAFARPASAIISLPAAQWAPVLYTGWTRAAMAQRNQEWMAALIIAALSGRPTGTATENEALSQLVRRADPALGGPDGVADPEPGVPAAIRNAITVLRFRYKMLKELDDDDHDDG